MGRVAPAPAAPATLPVNSSTTAQRTDLTSEARRLALGGLPDWAIELEQMRREVRELRAQEKKAEWDLQRQEKADVSGVKKYEQKEIAEWRAEQSKGLKELAQSRAQEVKAKELQDNLDFVTFKKERKQLAKKQDQEYLESEYEKTREYALWKEERAANERSEFLAYSKSLEEKHLIDREVKQLKAEQAKIEEKTDREHEKALEIEKMKKDLAAERANLLRRVEYNKRSMNRDTKANQAAIHFN